MLSVFLSATLFMVGLMAWMAGGCAWPRSVEGWFEAGLDTG